MFQPADVALLESGCALIVGLVTSDGAPFASRGWGLTIDPSGGPARLLVDAGELERLGGAATAHLGRQIAVTGCSVITLRGRQLKGPLRSVEPATNADRRRSDEYCRAYFDDVATVDGIPRRLMERMVPEALAAWTFDVEEAFDQTPGPKAGTAL